MEQKFSHKNFLKIAVYLTRLSSFPKIPENAVPLMTKNFWKFKLEFFIEWKVCQTSYIGLLLSSVNNFLVTLKQALKMSFL